jgi:D-alanyl-lipoteichoic acid acyltransferase DltB (MBOAT superfamily)
MSKGIVSTIPKIGNYILIIISYGLYIKYKPIYALILLGVTIITYVFALLIEKRKVYGNKKYIIFIGILFSSLPLLIFKYYNFFNTSLIEGLSFFGIKTGLPGLNWVMPLGISFFTLQAIGYLVDVYLQRIRAEHNLWDYMLFVCFFPQIASGPISKAIDLLPQIKSKRVFIYDKFVEGLQWLLWGMFLKVTVADRLSVIVDSVYDNWIYKDGTSCLIASMLYTFQIYSDFAGYSFMAVGVGKVLGFDLINNFNRPYLSMSVTEFWHRWHISLSIWLKDYIYIPLGGNRCSKTKNYWNIFATFLVSGFWHGANWTFIVWGILHGIFQIIEKALHVQKSQSKGFIRIIRIFITFLLVNFAWIFFRMSTLADAFGVVSKIILNQTMDISTFMENKTLLFPLYILIIKDIVDEFFPRYNLYNTRNLYIRWITYVSLMVCILLFGIFDAGQFIYVSF